MYQETWDPEGFYSTIPSIATGISGMLCGTIILNKVNSLKDKIISLFFWGSIVLIVGYFWDYIFPINKHIWTSSYVLYSSGLAMIILAISTLLIDETNYTSNIKIGLVFGSTKNKEIDALKDKIKIMSISKSVDASKGDIRQTKLKINEYIREIDKCIAQLNN